ncbi:MAG: aminoacyl-tRNA hydrolase [Candidatus Doudnabacteria bacterium RIFCSPHIGHO2_01_FULL_45_18]|uniref:Peptidyl-tRNA hydrolase n=1 Tax=Candidatus Doudnabacteria bacterium RIFCSPHIGHO2_01_FULL_45_18 TaxID=1817823 RepID=A0A1F5NSM2_9BACT|nr:MAG: aminoacyl-tRNA hydrolase [Candidatus Doudnabacteria bacterium RIFCSPHIGHO2_01_FULL_45_18]
MYLIVGLGNLGFQYENTRHNFGFRVLDLLVGSEAWENKYDSQFLKLDDVILAKPQTFMNKSGEAVKEILKFYPTAQLVVVHDELDLPIGAIKIQKNITGAGHNGVQSIIDEIGTKDFIRLRLGIDNPDSRFQIPDSDAFVLQKFTPAEEVIVKEVLAKTKDAIETLQTQGLEMAQSKFNG